MKIKLSVIIPCFNEEDRFKEGFKHYLSFLNKQKYSWELIFVNDGSQDRTLNLMQSLALKNKNIKIESYTKNQGKGYAIGKGVKASRGENILFADIDHSVPINSIENFLKYFEKGFKVVIGSRRVKGSKILIHQHPLREFLGRGFTFLVRLLIDWEIKDATCGFKAIEKNVARR